MSPVLPPLTFFLSSAKPSGLRKVGVVLVLVLVVVERTYCLTKGNVVFFPTHIFLLGGIQTSSDPYLLNHSYRLPTHNSFRGGILLPPNQIFFGVGSIDYE